jgi:hypothetical protein
LTILCALLVLMTGAATAQTDWSRLGFKAEPGLSVGTPCALNLNARFWLGNFGISTCGIYLPSGISLPISTAGLEADVMYKLVTSSRQPIQPYIALGYGLFDISTSMTGVPNLRVRSTSYGGLQVGAYYQGAFAQVGIGVGQFSVSQVGRSSTALPVFPLFQIGYVTSLGSGGGGGGREGGGNRGGGGK